MRKIMRLILLLLAPTLLLVSMTVALAAAPDAINLVSGNANRTIPNTLTEATSVNQVLFQQALLTGLKLEITHTTPAVTQIPVHFTATVVITPSTSLINASLALTNYLWFFGDGSDPMLVPGGPSNVSVVTHTYTETRGYSVTARVLNETGGELVSDTISISVGSPWQVYLPVVFQNFSQPGPDLICRALRFEPSNPSTEDTILLTVEMENQGGQRADGFWVDLYINPTETVTGNQRWGTICGPPADCLGGIAWSISEELDSGPIFGGATRELLSIPSDFIGPEEGFDPIHSEWDGKLPAGDHKLFAYVDSWHPSNSYGAVLESNENNNRCGPVSITVTPASSFKTNFSRPGGLPKRPKP